MNQKQVFNYVKAAHRRGTAPSSARRFLTSKGVSKGSVSKAVQVLEHLNRQSFAPGDFSSLSGAYDLVRCITELERGLPPTHPIVRYLWGQGWRPGFQKH